VPTLRVYHLLGAVGMSVMFVWRNAITQETQNGLKAMREHAALHPWQSLGRNLRHLAALGHRPGLSWVVAFYVLTFFIEQMNLFQILFFSDTLGFGAVTVSLVPVATATVIVLIYGLMYGLLRRFSSVPAERSLLISSALGLIGAALIVLIPSGNLPMLLAAVCVFSGASFLTRTYRDTVLFGRLPEQGAADLFSAVQVLTMLFSIPAAGIAGTIFAVQPLALFVLIALLNAALLVLAWVVSSRPAGNDVKSL
jgi:hypothetical protein